MGQAARRIALTKTFEGKKDNLMTVAQPLLSSRRPLPRIVWLNPLSKNLYKALTEVSESLNAASTILTRCHLAFVVNGLPLPYGTRSKC